MSLYPVHTYEFHSLCLPHYIHILFLDRAFLANFRKTFILGKKCIKLFYHLKIFDYYLTKLSYLNGIKKYSFVNFDYINFNKKNIDLLLAPSNIMTSLNWMFLKNKFCFFYLQNSKFVFKKIKYFKNKLYLWIEDFYLNNKDLYSSYSLIMLECSKSYRKTTNNFLY